jgi:hypothetical protein
LNSKRHFLELVSDFAGRSKKIFRSVPEGERMEDFERLFDKMRHRQSDKFRRVDRMSQAHLREEVGSCASVLSQAISVENQMV